MPHTTAKTAASADHLNDTVHAAVVHSVVSWFTSVVSPGTVNVEDNSGESIRNPLLDSQGADDGAHPLLPVSRLATGIQLRLGYHPDDTVGSVVLNVFGMNGDLNQHAILSNIDGETDIVLSTDSEMYTEQDGLRYTHPTIGGKLVDAMGWEFVGVRVKSAYSGVGKSGLALVQGKLV